jgi:hypothetical protein
MRRFSLTVDDGLIDGFRAKLTYAAPEIEICGFGTPCVELQAATCWRGE